MVWHSLLSRHFHAWITAFYQKVLCFISCRRRIWHIQNSNKIQLADGIILAGPRFSVRGFPCVSLLGPWFKAKELQRWWSWWIWWNPMSPWLWNSRYDGWWWDQCNDCQTTSQWSQTSRNNRCLSQRHCVGFTILLQNEQVLFSCQLIFVKDLLAILLLVFMEVSNEIESFPTKRWVENLITFCWTCLYTFSKSQKCLIRIFIFWGTFYFIIRIEA